MKRQLTLATLVLAGLAAAGNANATLVLDTGTPGANATKMLLGSNDSYAAEFSLSTTSQINSLSAYLVGDLASAGDTYTLQIYAGSITSRYAVADYTFQSTFMGGGWNTTSLAGQNVVEGPGNYWMALSVGASDSSLGLGLPGGNTALSGGTASALGYAFNYGPGYTTSGALPFGARVDVSPVPLPATGPLLAAGLAALVGVSRRRRDAA